MRGSSIKRALGDYFLDVREADYAAAPRDVFRGRTRIDSRQSGVF
jgi:hypothetical protein